jgi:hypothetical protein
MTTRYSGDADENRAPGGSDNIFPEGLIDVLQVCVDSKLSDDQIVAFLELCEGLTSVQYKRLNQIRDKCSTICQMFGRECMGVRVKKILHVIRGLGQLEDYQFDLVTMSEDVFVESLDEDEIDVDSER